LTTSTALHSKTAIMMGASRGIGLAAAQALATAGTDA
jgi:NAD(P)-dependent dehydrogenase (short-subunit alcohol dehydrogenase family)